MSAPSTEIPSATSMTFGGTNGKGRSLVTAGTQSLLSRLFSASNSTSVGMPCTPRAFDIFCTTVWRSSKGTASHGMSP
eukprot:scaffold111_cov252-Pinguiococcus_pyrenoidosus.AAC.7